jgi:predicted AlkP superfamily phosphohydrolase/phosphomutase
LTLKYKVGLVKKISAICQLYLCSVPGATNAALEFYVSSPEINPNSPALPFTEPARYAQDLADAIGVYHTLGIPEDFNAAKSGHLPLEAFYNQCRAIEAERLKMFRYELNRFSNGVLAVVFDTSDRWQHLGWEPGEPGSIVTNFSPKVVEYYEQHADPLLGEISKVLDEDTALIVFSDHGFSSYSRSFNLNNWLVENGYMTVAPDADQENSALFKKVNWERTKAYSVGFTSIYLNRTGREGKGVVVPADADRLKQEIAQRLKQYVDPDTGVKPIEEVYDGMQLYYGDRVDEAPDLVIGLKPGYRMGWQTAIGAIGKAICEDNEDKWRGDHLIDAKFVPGIFLANIPMIDQSPRTIDLAPTILDCAGLKVPGDMDGISLRKPHELQ